MNRTRKDEQKSSRPTQRPRGPVVGIGKGVPTKDEFTGMSFFIHHRFDEYYLLVRSSSMVPTI